MKADIETALDQCLVWMREGLDIDSCLAQYPEYADELAPLLDLVPHVAMALPPTSPSAARATGEERMLAALARKQARQAAIPPFIRLLQGWLRALLPGRPGSLRPAWQTASMLALVLLVVAGGATAVGAAGSLPGDALYPVKLASQEVQLGLTLGSAQRGALQERFGTQRRQDVQAVLAGGGQATVEFEGVLQQIEAGFWVVSGLTVTLQEETEIQGQPQLGAAVRVHGDLPGDGRLLAVRISVEPGALPWVSDTPEATETAQPSTTPQPTETPEPTDTPTPTETEPPATATEASSEETPSATPEPSATSTPSQAPSLDEPTETPQPTVAPTYAETEEPESEDTPEASRTVEPPGDPEPDETTEPNGEPEPDEPTKPTDSPEPEETPDPDQDGDPTEEPDPDHEEDPTEEPGPERTPEDEPDSAPTFDPDD